MEIFICGLSANAPAKSCIFYTDIEKLKYYLCSGLRKKDELFKVIW